MMVVDILIVFGSVTALVAVLLVLHWMTPMVPKNDATKPSRALEPKTT